MSKIALPACARSGLLSVGLLLGSASAFADSAGLAKLPNDIVFESPAGGMQSAVLYGDPAKPGFYVLRLKLPAGAKVSPHTHPEGLHTVTVLSGTLYFGSGAQWDESKLRPYPPGTFFIEPPDAAHFVAAKDGEVVVQISGIGPLALVPTRQAPQ